MFAPSNAIASGLVPTVKVTGPQLAIRASDGCILCQRCACDADDQYADCGRAGECVHHVFGRHNSWISSRRLFFVSGTLRHTKAVARRLITP